MTLSPKERARCGLPIREFLYTLDQIAFILNVRVETLNQYVWFPDIAGGKPQGKRKTQLMKAVNVVPSDMHAHPEWRVPEGQLIQFLKHKNIHVYERKLK